MDNSSYQITTNSCQSTKTSDLLEATGSVKIPKRILEIDNSNNIMFQTKYIPKSFMKSSESIVHSKKIDITYNFNNESIKIITQEHTFKPTVCFSTLIGILRTEDSPPLPKKSVNWDVNITKNEPIEKMIWVKDINSNKRFYISKRDKNKFEGPRLSTRSKLMQLYTH